MELFRYKGIDAGGRVRRGFLSAHHVDDLEARVQRMGLALVSCSPANATALRFYRRAIRRRDLIDFCFQLDQLSRAGVPLLQALADVRDSLEQTPFREIVSGIIDRVAEGRSLSRALADFPSVFDAVFVSLVHVGEQSGALSEVLRELTETLKWQDELAAHTKRVLLYPLFVTVVVLGVVLFLMVYLVPQLVAFITNMQGTLPLHTRALLAVSALLVDYWPLLLGGPLALFGALMLAAQSNPAVRLRLDEARLRVWVIGDILRKLTLARFARVFALMYRSGVPVLEILTTASRLAGNGAVARAIDTARGEIGEGSSLGRAFERSGLFPPLLVRMISVGETTGGLDQALTNVGYFYDRDVKERIEKLEAIIEPLMTVTLGLILGWIMLAVLGPIYDLVGSLGR